MSKTISPLDQPSRRGVEALFRELSNGGWSDGSPASVRYEQLSREYDALEAKLLSDPKLKVLKAKKDQAWETSHRWREGFKLRLRKVRQSYLAQGLTAQVKKDLRALVEEANRRE